MMLAPDLTPKSSTEMLAATASSGGKNAIFVDAAITSAQNVQLKR